MPIQLWFNHNSNQVPACPLHSVPGVPPLILTPPPSPASDLRSFKENLASVFASANFDDQSEKISSTFTHVTSNFDEDVLSGLRLQNLRWAGVAAAAAELVEEAAELCD